MPIRHLAAALLSLLVTTAWAATGTDDGATIRTGSGLLADVLTNDIGVEHGIIAVGTPSNGTAAVLGNRLYFRPPAGFSGVATIGYTLADGRRHGTVRRGVLSQASGVPVYESGYGSAIALAPAGDYYLLTDRGPNIDGATSTEKVFPVPDYQPRIGRFQRQSDGSFALAATILLKRPDGVTPISGLPNPTNSTGETALAAGTGTSITYTPDTGPSAVGGQDTFGLDTEGLVVAGSDFWICDEYGPYLVKFDASGVEQERVSPMAVNTAGRKLPAVLQRRRPNRGMEGLCLTPGGKLVGIMQNAVRNNVAGTAHSNSVNNKTPTVRILVYDPATGTSQQYVYLLTNPSSNVALGLRISEIACINESKFLVLERDDAFPTNGSTFKKLYEIDLSAATDVSDSGDRVTGKLFQPAGGGTADTLEKFTESMDTAAATTVLAGLLSEDGLSASAVIPVSKVERVDLIAQLGAAYNHDKVEGLAVLATSGSGSGEQATRIVLTNDDDFGIGNGSTTYAVATKASSTGLPDCNEVLEIDLTLGSTSTATLTVTVDPQSPYLVGAASGVQVRPLLTVGDTAGVKPDTIAPWRMVGIPDGLGAFDNGNGTVTMLLNHELGSTNGIVRDHGSKGAFISRLILNKTTREFVGASDHVFNGGSVRLYNSGSGTWSPGTTAFSRFCSADLAPSTAFKNGTKGTDARLYLTGEESGDEGRAFAHIATGPSTGICYELPHVGKASWENQVASPFAQDKTIVIGTDDTTPGQVYVYVGTKTDSGNDIEKAGLVGGSLFGVKVGAVTAEDRTTALGAAKGTPLPFTLASLGNVASKTGAAIQAESVTAGITQFLRPEDGAWDPAHPADFYFVTTDRMDAAKNGGGGATAGQVGRSRLWRLRFSDIANPENGGTITMLIDGAEDPGPQMMDNLCIDSRGRILLQEDPGGNAHNAKIWGYDSRTGTMTVLAKHDPAKFGDLAGGVVTPVNPPYNNDEESSGIIDASSLLGDGWFLFGDQAHYALADSELVQGGQLLALYVPANALGSASKGGLSTETAYIIPAATGVKTLPLLTVGESVNLKPDGITPYRMVGIPDGMGGFDNGDGTFTLLMNHELGGTSGAVRAHGNKGAFVSTWKVSKTTGAISSGADLLTTTSSVQLYNSGPGTWSAGTTVFSRFCSADLAPTSAFKNGPKGTDARLFLTGEETGDEGRAMALIASGSAAGTCYELPHLGKSSWENLVASPFAQDKTIVIGTDDTTPGQVYVYVGAKTDTGNDIEKAGLAGGILYGIQVGAVTSEDRTTALGFAKGGSTPFALASLGNVSAKTGAVIQSDSIAAGITQFLRPEDGAWDPTHPADFYFVTTDRLDAIKNGGGAATAGQVGRSRLWRLRFTDIANPETGGTITMLIDGSEDPGPQMMDNMCIDSRGRIFLQEDPGGTAHNAKIWGFNPATGSLLVVAKHDPARFGDLIGGVATAATAPFNNDEESSGIIDAKDLLGDGWFLLDDQAHYALSDTELVQGGQLIAMYVPSTMLSGTGSTPGSASSSTPYLTPVATGVQTRSLLTVGESVNLNPDGITPYRMVGIPDGLGAYDNGDGTFSLLMNHEIGGTAGVIRDHGSKGAFVSKWTISATTMQVSAGTDLIPTSTSVQLYSSGTATWTAGTTAFSRLCSADLAPVSAFKNGPKGTDARIFLNGEEAGDEGRAFGHIATGSAAGTTFELPHLGKSSWENQVASPYAQDKTIVIGTDDSTPGQVYVYVGTKTDTGNDIQKAGLTGGTLYGVKVGLVAAEDRTTALGVAKNQPVNFSLASLGDVSAKTGATLQADSVAAGITQFLRPEDGAWDPTKPGDFYFVTTDRMDATKNGGGAATAGQVGRSRLWRLRFTNIANPENGGTITMLIDGAEDPGPQMMDNLCIDTHGRILLQEDPGGTAHNAKIWSYRLNGGKLDLVAKHDVARFGDLVGGVTTAATAPFTNDEESSGIIDAKAFLGDGWFLLDDQAHYGLSDAELVQGGQLLALYVPPPSNSGGGSGGAGGKKNSSQDCGVGNGIAGIGLLLMLGFTGRRRRWRSP